MEFYSPVYELLNKCEDLGMHPIKGYDLIPEGDLLILIQDWLSRRSHG
jgi:hypothetical protein